MKTFDLERFRHTVPYIHAHRGRRVVLCIDSAALEAPGARSLLSDIAQLHALGMRVVLVFGTRSWLDCVLSRSQFHEGCRITPVADMPQVAAEAGTAYAEIQTRLSCGLMNTPMAGMQLRVLGGNLVAARPRGIRGGVDFQRTGEVRRVDVATIDALLEHGAIVLIPPLGYSPIGEAFNLDAITLASSVAQEMAADKLIYLHGETALRARRGIIRQMTATDALALLRRRRLTPTWRRLLQGAVDACLARVGRVHLLDARRDGVLPQELFTRSGSGIMLTREEPSAPRQAGVADIGGIQSLIAPLIEQGALVARSREEIEPQLANYRVIEIDGLVVACVCLHPLDATHAEMVCLAVHTDYRKQGFGRNLLDDACLRAQEQGINKLYALTTQAMHWFVGHGFVSSSPRSLPVARRAFYNNQRNAKVLMKTLESTHG